MGCCDNFKVEQYLEVAGVHPGAGDAVHHAVQCRLVLLQVVGLVPVQQVVHQLLPHLQPPAHVLVQDLRQAALHAGLHHDEQQLAARDAPALAAATESDG